MKLGEKIKSISNNKSIKIICLILLPLVLELIISGKIETDKQAIMRIMFVYGIYVLAGIFYIINKKLIKVNKMLNIMMRYRYLIALIFLVLLVLLKVNFSSISMWSQYMNEPKTENVLMGEARAIRSDEWLTQSSTMLGQAESDEYKIHNKNIAQGTSNMLMISAPVADILAISRPLTWGFLLFGREYGFSFYWVLKMIALIMVSIELVKKISNKNNLLSIVGGIILGLAPAMMWWLSTAVVDGYIYGTAVIILFGYYMQNLDWKMWKKVLIAIRNCNMSSRFCIYAISGFPSAICVFNGCIYDK